MAAQEDKQTVVGRFIRAEAVAPLDSNSPGLSHGERRGWWEFCLDMNEFFGALMSSHVLHRDQEQQLARLRWILLKGTYVFSTQDPALRGEQARYVELCVVIAAAFAVIVDDQEGILETFHVFGARRFWSNDDPKWFAEAEAIMENRLSWQKDWEHAISPVRWIKIVSKRIHNRHALGEAPAVSDALYTTPTRKRDEGQTCREVIPLEETGNLSDIGHESLLPRWIDASLGQLKLAVQEDEDLRAYIELRTQGYKPQPAWIRLGWDVRRGRAVDRRFRRLREKIKTSGFDYEARDVDLEPGRSDASCTVVKERLRIPIRPGTDATLSGRVVYEPRVPGERIRRSN